MNCPFSSIVCLQAGLDRDAPPRTLQKMSQKSDSFAWNFCELYVIEKTQNAFGEFRAANVSSLARPLMTVGRPIQTHGPGRGSTWRAWGPVQIGAAQSSRQGSHDGDGADHDRAP